MPLSTPSLPPQVQHAPVAFVENRGQASPSAVYQSSSLGYKLEITARGAVIRKGKDAASLRFLGAGKPAIAAAKPLAAKYHLYRGQTRRENLPMFGEVRQNSLYHGIDAVYYGSQSNLEYDMVVHPNADPRQIRFRFEGASKVSLGNDGSLSVEVNGSRWQQKPPLAFQQSGKRLEQVEARYAVSEDGAVSFTLGEYDRNRTLTIDPVLSPFGNAAAAGLGDAMQVAIDLQNNIYAAGSIDIAKFSPQGTLLYQFQVADDPGTLQLLQSIAVASDGGLVAGGITDSRDIPTTANAFQRNKDVTFCGGWPSSSASVDCRLSFRGADGFLLRLRPDGTLQWATYLGAGDRDNITRVAFGPGSTVYAAGETESNFFPTVNQFQGCSTLGFSAFLTVLRADGTDVNYSTCMHPTLINATRFAVAKGLAVDSTGAAYIAGYVKTGSGEFTVQGTGGAAPFQATPGGGEDGFIAKINPALSGNASLVYSTLLGGSGNDRLEAIVLEPGNIACAAGHTASANFPKVAPAGTTTPLHAFRGPRDLTVTCLSANAGSLTFSNSYGVQVDSFGIIAGRIPVVPLHAIHRDLKGGLHVTDRMSGSFTPVNPFDNAGGSGTGTYLRLRPATRVVHTLSHTTDQAGAVVTDATSGAFIGSLNAVHQVVDVCAPDITTNLQIIQGNIIFDVATGRFRQIISVRSLVAAPVDAGARLVFTALPQGVNVFNAASNTTCFSPVGSPFVTLPIIPPVNAGFATITVEFTTTGAGIFYIPKVAAPGNGI